MEQMNTVFVTGGAGFIGSNYLNKYVPIYKDTLFVNLDALTYAADLANITVSDYSNYIFLKLDIRDRKALSKAFETYAPDGVIHFAAESHVDYSIARPELFIETNVVGTHNLLAESLAHTVKRFHQISTDEVYGSLLEDMPAFTEESTLAPNNPYSASKAAADLLVRSYHQTFGLDVVITRCSNNYGPNQDATKLIPLFLKKLLAGENVPLYGTGENVREWLFVEDAVTAIDCVFRKGISGEVYNIGGGVEVQNIAVVRQLLALTGLSEKMITYVTDRPGHDFRYALDSTKILNELGWSPTTSFEEGLKKTYDFFVLNYSR